jgi:hypothetical protein
MSTPTLDQLFAAGQLVVEPKASLDLPSHQVLTVLRVEIAPHTVEPPTPTPAPRSSTVSPATDRSSSTTVSGGPSPKATPSSSSAGASSHCATPASSP